MRRMLTGSGRAQVLFYYAGDGNWWLGDLVGGQLGWSLVSNTAEDLVFADAERAQVLAEVQGGLGVLAGFEPNRQRHLALRRAPRRDPGAPRPQPVRLRAAGRLWRDPAMQALGYGPGLGEVGCYIQDLRTRLSTDWTYCVFFTKYPCHHFAYANLGGPRIVMQYANDGWGPATSTACSRTRPGTSSRRRTSTPPAPATAAERGASTTSPMATARTVRPVEALPV